MKQLYVDKKFTPANVKLIEQAETIIVEYQAQGFTLTLRQLYYQFVSRDLIPNKQTEYKRLGGIINDARLAGLIDWDAIEDRTRNLMGVHTWDSPADLLDETARRYKSNLWDDQEYHCEVWIEKDALVGVIEPVCTEYRVDYFACRGYSSQSEQRSAGKRLIQHIHNGKKIVVFHLGDHDPSGIDMTRDNEDRLRMFITADADADSFEIRRLALNMDQVKKYKPPPNPAKMTDSRFDGYVKIHGNKSWELDALNPTIIGNLIKKNIVSLIDDDLWQEATKREQKNRDKLHEFVDQARMD